MPVLTAIDILGIQRYVFASNRLRDALAASWMVDHVTHRTSLARWGLTEDRVLVDAGGNAIVEFDSQDRARAWTTQYTRWLNDTAPGLESAIVHRQYEHGQLAWALRAMQIDLAVAKSGRRPSTPQLGLGVTASCEVTGFPAAELSQNELVSPRIKRLRERNQEAKERWVKYLPRLEQLDGWTAEFPDDLDLLGRSYGQTSMIGILHIDGNDVGQAMKEWLDRSIEDRVADQEVRSQYRQWSEAFDMLGDLVLRVMIERVSRCICPAEKASGKQGCVVRGLPDELSFAPIVGKDITKSGGIVLLPLRPILLGGDDLTVVCDGRIAIDLAVTALRKFVEHPIPYLGTDGQAKCLTACAGVAIVKAHSPFYRGYELAERLCRSAKQRRRHANQATGIETGCWIDWHIGAARTGDSVEDIRKRQYQRDGNILTMRPYPVTAEGRSQCWDWFDKELLGPGDEANNSFRGHLKPDDEAIGVLVPNVWSGSRSRVKRLESLVQNGPTEVERQVLAWGTIESKLRLPGGLPNCGFSDGSTPLTDAIELMDLHLRLEPPSHSGDGSRITGMGEPQREVS